MIVRSFEGCEAGREGCTAIRLRFPVLRLASAEAAAAVNGFVRAELADPATAGSPVASPEQTAERFLEDYRRAREEFEHESPWSVERSVEILLETPRVLSLSVSEYAYRGGAHPNSQRTLASFSPRTGRRLVLADLLAPGAEEPLRALAEVRFREQAGLAPGASLNEAGYWFDGDRFALNDNFALVPEGLRFHFQAYEIAPYALGPTELLLPREALAGIARPEGPLAP